MGIRENLKKLIAKKLEENVSLERQIMENKAYIQGLQDSMKLLPGMVVALPSTHCGRVAP